MTLKIETTVASNCSKSFIRRIHVLRNQKIILIITKMENYGRLDNISKEKQLITKLPKATTYANRWLLVPVAKSICKFSFS